MKKTAKPPRKSSGRVRTKSANRAASIKAVPLSTPNRVKVAGKSKLDALVALLRQKTGASLEQMMKATGWQAHSVRGAISGSIKKKLGLKVTSTKTDGIRVYRIAG